MMSAFLNNIVTLFIVYLIWSQLKVSIRANLKVDYFGRWFTNTIDGYFKIVQNFIDQKHRFLREMLVVFIVLT